MKYFFKFLLLLIVLFFTSCKKEKNKIKNNNEIDNYIVSLMEADKIPGLAIGVVKNGQVIHKKNYGVANIAHKVPVTDSTLFRLYSTSKLISSVATFQLIERKKVTLNDPISKYIDNLPIHWGGIKVEHLLTHSSGLPEYKDYSKELSDKSLFDEIIKKPLHFKSGAKYEYNQTNFWFLKLIIEKVTKQRFEDFVKKNQFENRHDEVIFASNSLIDYPNRVAKYQFNKEYDAYEISSFEAGNRSLAGNGLNTNLNTLLDWNTKLDKNQLLTKKIKDKMMSPYEYQDDALSFGYSWGIFGPVDKQYYGFAGGGVCALMKFLDKDLTIIILSNGFKNRPVISNAVTYISGLIDTSLVRKDRMLNEDVRLSFILNDYDKATELYEQLKSENKDINFERALNSSGYYYLEENQIDKSIRIFKLYTKEYPISSNAFDGLGEAYFKDKDYNHSQLCYQKSLDLDPNNKNAENMIEKINNGNY